MFILDIDRPFPYLILKMLLVCWIRFSEFFSTLMAGFMGFLFQFSGTILFLKVIEVEALFEMRCFTVQHSSKNEVTKSTLRRVNREENLKETTVACAKAHTLGHVSQRKRNFCILGWSETPSSI